MPKLAVSEMMQFQDGVLVFYDAYASDLPIGPTIGKFHVMLGRSPEKKNWEGKHAWWFPDGEATFLRFWMQGRAAAVDSDIALLFVGPASGINTEHLGVSFAQEV